MCIVTIICGRDAVIAGVIGVYHYHYNGCYLQVGPFRGYASASWVSLLPYIQSITTVFLLTYSPCYSASVQCKPRQPLEVLATSAH